jgi:hypothetical protein
MLPTAIGKVSIANVIAACLSLSFADRSLLQRRHALRRRIPVTLRRPPIVASHNSLPIDGAGQSLLK